MENFYERKNIDKSTVELKITIPKDDFRKSYTDLLQEELKNTNLKGFRKGKVPESLVEKEIGGSLKIQAFEKIVPYYVSTALQKENITPIASLDYKELPNLEKDEDLVFTIDITVMPEFKIGDLKKIKVEKEEAKVTEKEVEEAMQNIFKNNKTKEKEINEEWAKEIIKSLKVDTATDLKSFKEFVKDTLKKQKEHMLEHEQEDSAFKQAIELSHIEIPQPAIEYEALEREHSFEHDMGHRNIKIEDFLKANDITMEKMRELWLKDSKEALESDVFLRLYSKEKGIKVTDEDLSKKIEEIKKGIPEGTDKSIFENEEWKEYVRRIEEKDRAFKAFSKEVLGK